MGERLVVRTMEGFGDNLWSRPVVLALARLYEPLVLLTPWPQAFADLAQEYPLQFGRPSTRLRTQLQNVQQWRGNWVEVGEPAFRLAYHPHEIARGANHHDSLEASAKPWLQEAGVSPLDIRMQVPPEWLTAADDKIHEWSNRTGRPVVLVRPPTVRKEWWNSARNCDPRALQLLVNQLRPHYTIVSVASLRQGEEWLERPELQNVDFKCHSGELSIELLMGLVTRCWTVGANGFTLPAILATGGWGYVLFGGNYGYNAPDRLLHPSYDMARLGYSEPDKPCRGCTKGRHQCNKFINAHRLLSEFEMWRRRQNTDEVELGRELRATTFGVEYYEEHRAAGLDYLGHGDWQRRYGRWFTDVFGWRGKRVLDLGCACGSIARGFQSAGARAYGVDINSHMIQLGKGRWPDMAPRLAEGDAANLGQFKTGLFEGLHCAQVAEHFDPEAVPRILQEVRRVLVPGSLVWWCLDTEELYARQGRRVETEDPTHICVRPLQWWRDKFREAGFADVTAQYLAPLRSHSLSMLQGSTSGSPSKYDWDFLVMQSGSPVGVGGWGRVEGSLESVAVVATGPSLKPFDLKLLQQVPVIAVNSAILHMPYAPESWVTVDTSAQNRAIMRQRGRWPSTAFYAAVPTDYGAPQATATNRRPPAEGGVVFLRRQEPSAFGLSRDPTVLTVGNSAMGALNVAYLKGAKRIALLGVDGTGGYAWGGGRPKNLRNLRDLFGTVVKQFAEEGVEVVVGSPHSVVDWWPRMSPEGALGWLLSGSIIERLGSER